MRGTGGDSQRGAQRAGAAAAAAWAEKPRADVADERERRRAGTWRPRPSVPGTLALARGYCSAVAWLRGGRRGNEQAQGQAQVH